MKFKAKKYRYVTPTYTRSTQCGEIPHRWGINTNGKRKAIEKPQWNISDITQ